MPLLKQRLRKGIIVEKAFSPKLRELDLNLREYLEMTAVKPRSALVKSVSEH